MVIVLQPLLFKCTVVIVLQSPLVEFKPKTRTLTTKPHHHHKNNKTIINFIRHNCLSSVCGCVWILKSEFLITCTLLCMCGIFQKCIFSTGSWEASSFLIIQWFGSVGQTSLKWYSLTECVCAHSKGFLPNSNQTIAKQRRREENTFTTDSLNRRMHEVRPDKRRGENRGLILEWKFSMRPRKEK